jgi:hypothetical protein
MTSLVRRSLRARAASRCMATSGRPLSQLRRSSWARAARRISVTADALIVRGRGSNSESSPNISPGPIRLIRFSRPSADVLVSLTLPSSTTYSRSPVSPSSNSRSPLASATSVTPARSAFVPSSSRASNSGARLSTSSAFSTASPRPLPGVTTQCRPFITRTRLAPLPGYTRVVLRDVCFMPIARHWIRHPGNVGSLALGISMVTSKFTTPPLGHVDD